MKTIPRCFACILALLCWIMSLSTIKTVPAFQTDTVLHQLDKQTYELPLETTMTTSQSIEYALTYLKQQDSSIKIDFLHEEPNYTDIYLQGKTGSMQLVLTHNSQSNHIYIGFPNITYDF